MRYFDIPFAEQGDRANVPDDTQPDGSASFAEGWGPDYERPSTDLRYKPVSRQVMNGLFHDITQAIQEMQQQGVGDWTAAAAPYPLNAIVRHLDRVWLSTQAQNTAQPSIGTEWRDLTVAPSVSGGVGVSLDGPVLIYDGSSNTYQITDFNSFSTYSVSVTAGTSSILDDVITVDIPAASGFTETVLTVTKTDPGANPVDYQFVIAVGAAVVNTPSVTFPGNNATNVSLTPTLTATDYATTPAGQGTHAYSSWQIATDSAFANIVWESLNDAVNLTSIAVPSGELSIGTGYYVRVKYASSTIGESAWSNTNQFATVNQYIVTPSVTVSGGPNDVGETPTITTSAFSVFGGSDTHASTDWEILLASNDSVIWQSLGNTVNRTSITVPAGVLQESTAYIARARHNGASLGSSQWGSYSFQTKAEFFVFGPKSAGLPYGGGYYAGKFTTGGKIYALVVAPRALGGMPTGILQWKTSRTTTAGTTSVNDGLANTNAMIAAGASAHPAANFCRNLSIAGYTDWYMPSKDELEICYRYLKPTTGANNTGSGANSSAIPQTSNYTSGSPAQTGVAIFQNGNTEAFRTDSSVWYWSSTEYTTSERAWFQNFTSGDQNDSPKGNQYWVRAVRRVEIPA